MYTAKLVVAHRLGVSSPSDSAAVLCTPPIVPRECPCTHTACGTKGRCHHAYRLQCHVLPPLWAGTQTSRRFAHPTDGSPTQQRRSALHAIRGIHWGPIDDMCKRRCHCSCCLCPRSCAVCPAGTISGVTGTLNGSWKCSTTAVGQTCPITCNSKRHIYQSNSVAHGMCCWQPRVARAIHTRCTAWSQVASNAPCAMFG